MMLDRDGRTRSVVFDPVTCNRNAVESHYPSCECTAAQHFQLGWNGRQLTSEQTQVLDRRESKSRIRTEAAAAPSWKSGASGDDAAECDQRGMVSNGLPHTAWARVIFATVSDVASR